MSEADGIERQLQRALVEELLLQSEWALVAYRELRIEVVSGTVNGAFFRLQALMSHLAAISKLLWPDERRGSKGSREDRIARRGTIRDLILGLSPPQMTLENRDFRNDLEHFDERLEEWANSPTGQSWIYVDMNLAPAGAFEFGRPVQMLRNLDPSRLEATFFDRTFPIPVAMAEVEELRKRASAWLVANPRW